MRIRGLSDVYVKSAARTVVLATMTVKYGILFWMMMDSMMEIVVAAASVRAAWVKFFVVANTPKNATIGVTSSKRKLVIIRMVF